MALLGISGCLGAEVGTPLRPCQSPRSYAWRSGCLSTLIVQDQDLVFFSFLDRQTSHAACFNARDYSMIAFFDALLFSSSLRPIGNLVSNRSALDLATLGILQTGQLLSWLLFFLLDWCACFSTCRWLQDFVMTPSRLLHLHIARGLVRHGYPLVPTDQAHDRPRQVGLVHQKTRRPNSGHNRTNLCPEGLPEDSSRRPYPIEDLECTSRC
jgi:hypothetical protein